MAIPSLSRAQLEPSSGVLESRLPNDSRAKPSHLHVLIAHTHNRTARDVQWPSAARATHHLELRHRLVAFLALLRLSGLPIQARRRRSVVPQALPV